MPRLSPTGNIAAGVAGHQGVINGAYIADSFGPYWMTGDLAVFGQPSNGLLVAMPIGGIRVPQYNFPYNDLRAGGNVWAAWSAIQGLRASTGYTSSVAGLLDVGPAGEIGIVPNRNVGWGCNVIEPNGEEWVLNNDLVVYDLQLLGLKRAIFRDHTLKIRTVNIPPCIQIGNAYATTAVEINGEWWVCYFSDLVGQVFHPFNSTIGYQVAVGEAWGVDTLQMGTLTKIVWSTTAGEGPGDIRERYINVAVDPRIQLKPVTPIPPIPPEEPVIEPAVSVDKWTLKNMNDGNEFIFHDRNNPEEGYKIRVWIQGGGMYAEIQNSKGTAQTGSFRQVEKCPVVPPIPPDPPVPPVSEFKLIKTYFGTYLVVDPSSKVVGHRQDKNLATKFKIVKDGDAVLTVGLQAPSGFTAVEPPNGILKADRGSIGDWERLFQIKDESTGEVSWKSDPSSTNKWLSAREDGQVLANADAVGPWEVFQLEDAPAGGGSSATVKVDGKFFKRENGEGLAIIQSSEFPLYQHYLDGVDITPVLAQRQEIGFNCLRVWLLMAPNPTITPNGFLPSNYPDFYSKLVPFTQLCASYGHIVEFTVFTGTKLLMPDQNTQIAHWDNTCNALRGQPNVLIEMVNESDQYDNEVTAPLQKPSGLIASHGSNGADHRGVEPFWDYTQYHTNGLSEFQRKVGHNAMEIADQAGIPCLSNENTRFTDNDNSSHHAYDAMAGSALLNCGACYHSISGKLSQLFGGDELARAQDWVSGGKSVPTEFQTGQYARHDDMNSPEVIRAYSRTLGDGRSHLVLIRV